MKKQEIQEVSLQTITEFMEKTGWTLMETLNEQRDTCRRLQN